MTCLCANYRICDDWRACWIGGAQSKILTEKAYIAIQAWHDDDFVAVGG